MSVEVSASNASQVARHIVAQGRVEPNRTAMIRAKRRGLEPTEAILRTAAQRMRPVLLTSLTTVLGLPPMVFALDIDRINRDIAIAAPSSQLWTQLSSAIAGGLSFATLLTLVSTPALLMLGENISAWWQRRPAPHALNANPAGGQLIG
jgi:multidrug efflux pump